MPAINFPESTTKENMKTAGASGVVPAAISELAGRFEADLKGGDDFSQKSGTSSSEQEDYNEAFGQLAGVDNYSGDSAVSHNPSTFRDTVGAEEGGGGYFPVDVGEVEEVLPPSPPVSPLTSPAATTVRESENLDINQSGSGANNNSALSPPPPPASQLSPVVAGEAARAKESAGA